MLLGDLGAEVIKVERPPIGDPARRRPDFFRSINRSKKSITLNLKSPIGRDILYRLVRNADVFTEGFRPGVVKRLSIDYATLSELNPQLIYCSISGYGQDGPYSNLPGHDLNYLAMSGMLNSFRDRDGNCIQPSVAIGDLSSGMFAVIGILSALLARGKTGRGQLVDVSMFDGLLSLMSTHFAVFFDSGKSSRVYDPGYGIYKAGDQKYFTLGIAHEDWFWNRLCLATELYEYKEMTAQERTIRREELAEKLQAVFIKKTRDQWIEILTQSDVPVARVQTLAEVANDPHTVYRGMIQEISLSSGKSNKQIGFPIKLSANPAKIQGPPPELGEHTDEILHQAEYTDDEISAFRREGVV